MGRSGRFKIRPDTLASASRLSETESYCPEEKPKNKSQNPAAAYYLKNNTVTLLGCILLPTGWHRGPEAGDRGG